MELETTFSGFSPEILLLLRKSRPSAVSFPSSSDIVPVQIANNRLSPELKGEYRKPGFYLLVVAGGSAGESSGGGSGLSSAFLRGCCE